MDLGLPIFGVPVAFGGGLGGGGFVLVDAGAGAVLADGDGPIREGGVEFIEFGGPVGDFSSVPAEVAIEADEVGVAVEGDFGGEMGGGNRQAIGVEVVGDVV